MERSSCGNPDGTRKPALWVINLHLGWSHYPLSSGASLSHIRALSQNEKSVMIILSLFKVLAFSSLRIFALIFLWKVALK